MPATTDLDAIKRKYNFKEIAVATWRDSNLSAHTALSGPGFSPNSSLAHNYKVNYDLLPQPTEDEETEGDFAEDEFEADAPDELYTTQPIDELDAGDEDIQQASSGSLPQDNTTQAAEIGGIDQPEAVNEESPYEELLVPESAMADTKEHTVIEDVTNAEPGSAPPEIDPGSDVVIVPEGSPIELDTSGPLVESASELQFEATDEAHRPGDSSDERRVSFAPGTPDPKPTERRKKAAKGTKGKKKRISVPLDSLPPDVMAMIDGKLEGLAPPPPDLEVPTDDDGNAEDSLSDLTLPNPETINESASHTKPNEDISSATTASEAIPLQDISIVEPVNDAITEIAEEAPADAVVEGSTQDWNDRPLAQSSETKTTDLHEDAAGEAFEVEPVAEPSTTAEKPSKKKTSKSGKEKDKSKKKSSKSKSKEDPPPLAGLGIDMLPLSSSHDEQLQGDGAAPPTEGKLESPAEDPLEKTLATISVEIRNDADTGIALGGDLPALAEDSTSKDVTKDDQQPTTAEPPTFEELTGAEDHVEDANKTTDGASTDAKIKSIENASALTDDGSRPAAESANGTGDTETAIVLGTAQGHPSEQENASSEIPPSPADSGVELDSGGAKETDGDAGSGTIDAENPEHKDLPSIQSTDVDQLATVTPADEESLLTPPDAPASTQEDSAGDAVKEEVEAAEVVDSQQLDEATTPGEDPSAATVIEETTEVAQQSDQGTAHGGSQIASIAGKVDDVIGSYEPPSIESVPEDLNPTPLDNAAAIAVAAADNNSSVPEDKHTSQPESDGVDRSVDLESLSAAAAQAPPSPTLSKSSAHGSRKHKADHWSRRHAENGLKEVFEAKKALEKSHGRSKTGEDEVRVREQPRPKSRRLSAGEGDDGERRRRRAARKAEEAARAEEERKRQAEEDERRRARRAAQQAAANEAARLDTEAAEREVEAKRIRHRGKEREPQLVLPRRDTKNTMPTFTMPSLPKALGLTNAKSVHGTTIVRNSDGGYVTETTSTISPTRHREDGPRRDPQEETKTKSPSSSNGEKSHHRRHHRHTSSGDHSVRRSKGGEHRTRRPSIDEAIAERPRSFLGGLVRF